MEAAHEQVRAPLAHAAVCILRVCSGAGLFLPTLLTALTPFPLQSNEFDDVVEALLRRQGRVPALLHFRLSDADLL